MRSSHFILVDTLMLACGTKLVQLFIDGRGPQLSDVVVDMAGAGTGVLVWAGHGGRQDGPAAMTAT